MSEVKDSQQIDDPPSYSKSILEGPVPSGDGIKAFQNQFGVRRGKATRPQAVIEQPDAAIVGVKSGYLFMGKMVAGLRHIDQLGMDSSPGGLDGASISQASVCLLYTSDAADE